MAYRLGLLGEIEFEIDHGEVAPLVRPNQRRLIAVLGCHYRQPVSSERLADLLELTPGGLRTRIRRIRQILGDDAIVTQASGYRLGDVLIDVEEFERERETAAGAAGAEQIAALEAALRFWRGEALTEFAHEPWAAGESTRLNELRSTTVDTLAECFMGSQRFSEAIALLEAEVAQRPFRDKARRLLMTALSLAGRTAEAMRAYQDYRTFLVDETGMEPPDETRELEQAIVAGEVEAPVLATPPIPETHPNDAVITLVAAHLTLPGVPEKRLAELRDQLRRTLPTTADIVAVHPTGFTTSFSDPLLAVAAAQDLQVNRIAVLEGATDDLGLAVGIHSGLGPEAGDTYVQATLEGAERVVQAAFAGQVLMTSATAELVGQHNDFVLLPRGNHRLHDGSAVGLIELLWNTENTTPGRLRTLTDAPTNIPAIRQRLIGRDHDLTTLHNLLDDSRLVTIVAPGGAGKSAIATEVAAARASLQPDGVFIAELAPIDDPQLIPDLIAAAVGLRNEAPGFTPRSLAAALRNHQLMLVIDNAEHLLDDVATVVEELLAVEGPSLIVTSREWLDVAGERTFRLPRLTALAPSGETYGAELFKVNALAAGVATESLDLDAVERLCERLDHLPLALELAAGAAIHLSPTQIMGSLDRGEGLASTRRRNRARRFTSVDEMIEGSFDLLDADERSLLLAIGVTRGPTSLEAIEGLWGQSRSTSAASVLGSLVMRSLVVAHRQDEHVSYSLLETVRDFARDRAKAQEQFTALQRAHRDWFLDWSTTTSLLEQYASTRRAQLFEAQLPNFREAMTFSASEGDFDAVHRQAIQLGSLWFTFLHGDEGLKWFELSESAAVDPSAQIHHLIGALTSSFASERWGTALDMIIRLTERCESEDLPEMALGAALVGVTQLHDPESGFVWIEAAERCNEKFGTDVDGWIHHLAGDLNLFAARYEDAVDRYRLAAKALDEREFAWGTGAGLVGIGLCLHALGHTDEALAPIEQSLDIARSMPDSLGGITRGVVARSVVLSASGRTDEARDILLRETDRNERRTAVTAIRAEPIAAVIHLALDLGNDILAHNLQALATQLGLEHRSPWQRLLLRLSATRIAQTPAQTSTETWDFDQALRSCRAFLAK